MVPIVFLIQCRLSDPFFGERYPFKLAGLLCRKEKEKGVESRPFLHFLNNLVGE